MNNAGVDQIHGELLGRKSKLKEDIKTRYNYCEININTDNTNICQKGLLFTSEYKRNAFL